MSGTAQDVARAEAAAKAAQAQLTETLGVLRERLQPRVLIRDGLDDLRDRGTDLADDAVAAARARPGVIATLAGAGLLFVLRRPVARLVGRLFGRRKPPARQRLIAAERN